jgi:hypothetical protein
MATTFFADTSGWMLWHEENTNPPPGPMVSINVSTIIISKTYQGAPVMRFYQ